MSLPPEAELQFRVSVRRTCSGGGHNSGPVRLWFNGAAIDSGTRRDAGSRFGATIDDEAVDYFLRSGFALSTTAGASRQYVDVNVDSRVACPGRPFTTFGVWTITPYPYYGTALFGPVKPTYALGSLGLVFALLLSHLTGGRRRR